MASSVWAFSRHATVPRRFPGYSLMAEVSQARMDFPSYPVDIVLPSFNHADTAHYKLFAAVNGASEKCDFGYPFARKPFLMAGAMDVMPIST